jgi:NADPH:quinone reductase-like Zn-dependent oxidoreductase
MNPWPPGLAQARAASRGIGMWVRAGHRLLVNGAASGVGTYTVQTATAGRGGRRGVQHA